MATAFRILTSAVVLTSAALVGCDSKEATPAPTPPAAPAPQVRTPTPAAEPSMTDQARNAATGAMDATRDAAAKATDATKDAAAASGATAAVDTATTEATTLMDQTVQYVKENKWEMADSSMKKLESIKDKLPESLRPRYDQVKTMYDSAKAGKSLNLPGM